MDLSNLKPADRSKKNKKRVGRGHGTGQGGQAGRGHKGAKSRSGFKFKRGFEGGQMPLHRRIPKRGFHNLFRTEYAVVNLDTLAERFEAGTVVTPELLRSSGLITAKRQPIKVLARGDISKKLTVQGMGLRRINHSVELLDTPETRGMIHKVRHLVTVQE